MKLRINWLSSTIITIIIAITFINTQGATHLLAQHTQDYFQQRVDYNMDIYFTDTNRSIQGKSRIKYYNQSGDTLDKLYFHLYWNAFQKGSAMDYQGRYVESKRKRMKMLATLTEDKAGSEEVDSLWVDGLPARLIARGTILEVIPQKPLLPHTNYDITLYFRARIPFLIRRAGFETDAALPTFSIAQWYPKLCHYDRNGWHPAFYVAREFYGELGDFKVTINAPADYIVAAGAHPDTAYNVANGRRMHHFSARNTHDFMWAADKKYVFFQSTLPDAPFNLNFYYKPKDETSAQKWISLQDLLVKAYPLIKHYFGPYLFSDFNVIHGGDGGMEYIMGTLIANPHIHTAIHEWMHSWFQGMLGSNELAYAWLDEGFTNYATARITSLLVPSKEQKESPLFNIRDYNNYYHFLEKSRQKDSPLQEEPMNTFADAFATEAAYGLGSYVKGSIFLSQLGYLVGDSVRDEIIRNYVEKWRFKHPQPQDFIRIAEKTSGLQLKWYLNFWTQTTKTINYGVQIDSNASDNLSLLLQRKGAIPMPIELVVYYKNGDKENHYIPLDLLMGEKTANEYLSAQRVMHSAWQWTQLNYPLDIDTKGRQVKKIVIDPSERMADIDRKDNTLVF